MICPHCGNDTEKIETPRIDIEKDDQGRMKTWTEIMRDQDGKEIRRRVDTYYYHKTGEIDTIRQRVIEGKAVISDNEIRHFVDGRRPESRKHESTKTRK